MTSSRLRRPLRSFLAGVGLSALVLAPAAGTLGTAAFAADPGDSVTLFNINDFHGRIDSNAIPLACTLDQARAGVSGNSVFLSAGDNYGASEFASFIDDEQPTIDFLNSLDLKASALGNHEYDQGKEGLKKKEESENWTYLGANVQSDDDAYQPAPYTIVDAGDVKVAVIGADTQETPELTSPEGLAGISFTDPVEAVNTSVKELETEHEGEYDLIVAEYHDGSPGNAEPGQAPSSSTKFDKIVTQTSADVDVIFNGHLHTAYDYMAPVPGQSGKTRPVVQTGSYGDNLGQVTLEQDEDGNWTVTDDGPTLIPTAEVVTQEAGEDEDGTYTPVETTCDDSPSDSYSATRTIVDKAIEQARIKGAVPVGSVAGDITTGWAPSDAKYEKGTWTPTANKKKGDDRNRPSALSNELADSMVWATQQGKGGAKADIGVMNPGGVRADLWKAPISGEGDGVVTYAEANTVVPFVNNLDTIDLTGAQLIALIEQQWQPDNPKGDQWLGLSKNVTYTYEVHTQDGKTTGEITSMHIDGEPVDLDGTYTVVAANFLVGGGDNFTAFSKGTNRADTGMIDRDAWIDYLKAHQDLAPDYSPRGIEVEVPEGTAGGDANDPWTVHVADVHSLSAGAPQIRTVQITLDGHTFSAPYRQGKDGTWAADVDMTVPKCTPAGKYSATVTVVPKGTGTKVELGTIEVTRDGDLPAECSGGSPTDPPTSSEPPAPSDPAEPSSSPSSEAPDPTQDSSAPETSDSATAAPAEDLARTGASVAPYAITAGLLILAGVSVLAIRRRLRRD